MGLGVQPHPSPLQARYRLRGFRPVARLRAGPFRVLELRARRPALVTRRELARALTVTHLPHDGLLFQR
ncbi:MAG TPA: hypothetical protein VFN65_06390 [Solirubrobacteraceae bacterium]|nr:hypothetical protein [Solirubrobacteraceae bacterium]